MKLSEQARTWANDIISTKWDPQRFRLTLRKESARVLKHLARAVYRAELDVWDLAGVAAVELDRRGRVRRGREVRFPLGSDESGPAPADEPCAAEDVLPTALEAALAVARPRYRRVQVRAVVRRPTRHGALLLVWLEHLPSDGQISVDLDPSSGERLGYCCAPFYRGSTRSAALTRFTVIQRAQQALDLPPGARLARAQLASRAGERVWRLRWEVKGEERRGFVKAALNGRTGEVCGFFRSIREVALLDASARPPREEAEKTLEVLVRLKLGEGASVSPLVPGAIVEKGRARAAWLSVVEVDGKARRVSLAAGQVRFRPDLPRRAAG